MLNIIVQSDARYNINKEAVKAFTVHALSKFNIRGQIEVGINIVGDRKMHELNKKYRGLDETTNILSFALEDPISDNLQHIPRLGFVSAPDQVLRLGDIVLSYPQVIDDAASDGKSVDEELQFLIEHGVKHLLGVHHE